MNTYESKTKAKTVAAVVTIVVIIGIVILIETLQKYSDTATSSLGTAAANTPTTPSTTSASPTDNTSTSSPTSSTAYKDGTYTADQQYYVPHGYEDIKVTLTVANGVVTKASIVNSENDRDSERYQEDFASGYKTYVIGKKLSDVKVAYIAGASDTTQGFNDAVAHIRMQAQA